MRWAGPRRSAWPPASAPAPPLEFIKALTAAGAAVRAYDPKAEPREMRLLGDVIRCDDPYAVAEGGDALLLATAWPEFSRLDFHRIRRAMQRPLLLDPHNLLDADAMAREGFLYFGTGRGQVGARERPAR